MRARWWVLAMPQLINYWIYSVELYCEHRYKKQGGRPRRWEPSREQQEWRWSRRVTYSFFYTNYLYDVWNIVSEMYECFLEYEVVVLFKSCIYTDERKSICDYFFPVLFGRVGVRWYLVLGGFLYSHYLRSAFTRFFSQIIIPIFTSVISTAWIKIILINHIRSGRALRWSVRITILAWSITHSCM